jgi:hypothetical protein
MNWNAKRRDLWLDSAMLTGSAEELDAQLPVSLVQFVGAHLELKNTLESAKDQMAAAAKAAKAEAKTKPTSKTAPAPSLTPPVEATKPAVEAPSRL